MTEVYIAASGSYYWIFQNPPPLLGVTYTVVSVTTPNSTPYADLSTAGIACFSAGTLIDTALGPRPVEALRPGDTVLTLDNGPQPLLWVGARRVSHAAMRAQPGLRPFLVRAHSFGPGRPGRDTAFSRQHRILLAPAGECLAPVHTLTALPGIGQTCPPAGISFHHLLTTRHNLIWSNGLLTETLLATAFSRDLVAPGAAEFPVPADMTPARPILPNRQARELAKRLAILQSAPPRPLTA